MEIERKFKLDRLPDNLGKGVRIMQGYLITGKNEVRLRMKGKHYLITYKGAGMLSRREVEIGIPKWLFKLMWPLTRGRKVEKIRYFRTLPNGLELEFDEYLCSLKGLFTVEVEFPDENSANKFLLPDDIKGEDVTDNIKYKNQYLAVHGIVK